MKKVTGGLSGAIRPKDVARIGEKQKLALEEIRLRCEEEGNCWLWKMSVNSSGYPQFRTDGELKMVRTYVLKELLGTDLPAGWWATSECRNKRCCSPLCLVGLARGRVMDRSYAAGARPHMNGYTDALSRMVGQGMAKLGFEGARFVREEGAGLTGTEAGKLYSVSKSTVCKARRGKTWRTVHPQASVFAWAGASVSAPTEL